MAILLKIISLFSLLFEGILELLFEKLSLFQKKLFNFEGVDSTSFNYGTTGQRANTLGLSPKLKIDQRKVYLYFINLST